MNIIDMYSPYLLRFAIEKELILNNDPKIASIIALKRLKKDPEYYHKNYGYIELQKAKNTKYIRKLPDGKEGYRYICRESDNMNTVNNLQKAMPHKYYKRVPKAGGGYTYYYTESEYKQAKSPSIFKSVMDFFGILNPGLAKKKVEFDYNKYGIKEKFDISIDSWTEHLGEYFKNKDKWQSFFSKEKLEKKKTGKKEPKKKEPSEKKKKPVNIKLTVMKFINDAYGEKKEEVKDETEINKESELKEKDKKISEAINEATPENRFEKEREILDVPEPENKDEIENSEKLIVEFNPKDTTITIPFYKGGDSIDFPAKDYTSAISKDIFLVNQKDILTKDKPSYIPEVDEEYFLYNRCFLPTVKMANDKYIVKAQVQKRMVSGPIGEDRYIIVSRDVLASMHDYYLKKAKELNKKEQAEREEKYGRKLKSKRVTMIPENKMTYAESGMIRQFFSESIPTWTHYKEIRNDLKQKTEDMEIQIEENYNTHAKGQETSYGDSGTKDNLLNDYGIKVKRQNGDEISEKEINEIKLAMDDLFSVFGNRSSMAKNFNLKISHSGDVNMHARKAVGLFIPSMNAIGVSAKYGQEGTGFILSHEWGHFMDYYIGEKNGKHYSSDDPGSIAGEIADKFRTNMAKKQKSKYINRTCECFARAMEQYWAIKTNNKKIYSEFNIGNHPTEEVFKERIMPLCERFLTENKELLKAIFYKDKSNKKYYRRVQ